MRKKRALTTVMTLTLVGLLLAGCGNSNGDTASKPETTSGDNSTKSSGEPLKLTFFDKNTGDAFNNEIAKEITKRTGVTVEIQQPTGNPTEKLNLMLASNDLPDIVLLDRGSDIVNKYIAAGAIIPLDDLIDKFGPDIKTMYGDILKKTRYSDGKNYYLSNWYGMDPTPVSGMNMRKDLLKQLAPDKAEGGKPFTTDEFEQLLKDYKEKFPTVDGKPTAPMTFNAENMGAVLGTFKGFWGMKNYYEDGDKLKFDVKDPRYKDMILYMNKLYREGLIDKDWAVSKAQTWEQKLSNGIIFATPGAYWDPGNANTALLKDGDPDKQFFAYKVVAPGVDPSKTTLGGRSPLGWDAIAITKTNKHPEETMKFMNFIASEEGQYLLMWGIEGKQWEMKDGKHTPLPGVLKQLQDPNSDVNKKVGVRKWTWFIKNGNGSDGTPYGMGNLQKGAGDLMANKNLSDTMYDSSWFDNLGPQGGTPDSLSYQKVQDIMKQSITKVIIANSEAEASSEFDKMLSDMKAAGDEKVEKIITDNYKQRKELWK